jgi:hypothetical protein
LLQLDGWGCGAGALEHALAVVKSHKEKRKKGKKEKHRKEKRARSREAA